MQKKSLIIFIIGLCVGILTSACAYKTAKKIIAMKKHKADAPVHTEPQKPFHKETGFFNDFDGNDPIRWVGNNISTETVTDHCIEGNCLKTIFPEGKYPGLNARNLPSDWSGFDVLAFNVYNPQDTTIQIGIQIKDKHGDSYSQRYEKQFALRSGNNPFFLNITGLQANNHQRNLDLESITSLVIYVVHSQSGTTLYFDNIRLEKALGAQIKGLQRFDFGPADSEVWPGFYQVTEKTKYNDETGYGWAWTGNLNAQDRHYPDSLFRDWVRGGVPFKADIENGQYVVYVMLEDAGYWEYYQNYEQRRFFAEDKLVGEDVMPPEIFFRDYYYAHLNHEDLPGQNIFKEYVQKRFIWKRFEVNVNDRQLTLKCEPGYGYACTLSALVVAPLSEDEDTKEYLHELDLKREESFNTQFTESLPKFADVPDQLLAANINNNFILFQKDIEEEMFPQETPRQSQVSNTITTTAALGETESFILGVYPIKDLGISRITITDFVSDDGAIVLSSDNVRIRTVQYKLKLNGPGMYTVHGELLRDTNSINISKGTTRFFWIDVTAPETAAPGAYHSQISFTTQTGKTQKISFELKFLPFTLDPLNKPVGLFYSIPPQYNWYDVRKSQLWTAIERQLKDIRDHGMNTLALGLAPHVKDIHENGDVELDFSFFDEFLHAYKHFGFNQAISGYGLIDVFKKIKEKTSGDKEYFEKTIQNAYKQIQWHAHQLAGVDIIAGLADEVSNVGSDGIKSVIDVAKVIKNAGLRNTAYLNAADDDVLFPYLTDATVNDGMHITDALLKKAKSSGTNLWFYNIGHDRFSFGYYIWKTQVSGRVQWHYQMPAVDPFFDLDGRESDFCASYPSESGPINAVWFELAREGIDDYRYLETLEQMISKVNDGTLTVLPENQKALDEVRKNAQAYLSALRKDIPIELEKRNQLPPDFYSANKKTIAHFIAKILSLTKNGIATPLARNDINYE